MGRGRVEKPCVGLDNFFIDVTQAAETEQGGKGQQDCGAFRLMMA